MALWIEIAVILKCNWRYRLEIWYGLVWFGMVLLVGGGVVKLLFPFNFPNKKVKRK